MKAAVMRAIGEPLCIEDIRIDTPGAREVIVRTAATGVCHSDLHVLEGSLPSPLPTVLGHEPAGVVEDVGSEVRHVAPGDHVIGCLSAFCGTCEYCVAGRPNLCEGEATMRRTDERRPGLRRTASRSRSSCISAPSPNACWCTRTRWYGSVPTSRSTGWR